jgi:hypothetical protein
MRGHGQTFGATRKANGASTAKSSRFTSTSTKKVSPASNRLGSGSSSSKRGALAAFGVETENDSRMVATICLKKLDCNLAEISVQKAKVDLLAQRKAAQNARKAKENQIRILELQLQMRQAQGVANGIPNPVPVIAQQMLPANNEMVFGNGDLGMEGGNFFVGFNGNANMFGANA